MVKALWSLLNSFDVPWPSWVFSVSPWAAGFLDAPDAAVFLRFSDGRRSRRSWWMAA